MWNVTNVTMTRPVPASWPLRHPRKNCQLTGPAAASAAGGGPGDAGAADAPELEAAAAALAGLLAAGAGDAPPPYARQRRGGGGGNEPTTIDAGGSPDWIMGLGKRDARYTPYISVGVLSNMQQFFDNLRNNLESLESLPKEEREVLLGQSAAASAGSWRGALGVRGSPIAGHWRRRSLRQRAAPPPPPPTLPPPPPPAPAPAYSTLALPRPPLLSPRPVTSALSAKQERAFRPRATAAYLHALRNHRPSHKIRNFVAEPEPASLRGSNHYDPNWLWTGLGRRR
ncbi:Protein of unknown function [Gryllus bimaculatus]|nr:Protein of unknown function [Gryllus bimaculatus]